MTEPKLHGWITVEYAKQIKDELDNFLQTERYKRFCNLCGKEYRFLKKENADKFLTCEDCQDKCQSMTTNAPNREL